jgi:hypothetical protein
MILVDSSVVLDVVSPNQTWSAWSKQALTEAAESDELAINPIIYAEISINFSSHEKTDEALEAFGFASLHLPYAAAFLAGKAFVQYRRRGGARSAPLPDFFIGAHAAVTRMPLLTRDSRTVATYFPTVSLIAPPQV